MRKKKSNYYFTSVHEKAIVEYANTEDKKRRSELYIALIGPAFDELVDKIVYTYKFTSLPNIDYLKEDCKVWLTTILDKYDPNKGSKAFSYFSVITKNWFIHKVKLNATRNRREVDYEEYRSTYSNNAALVENANLVTYNPYLKARADFEFWQKFWKEFSEWDSEHLKENERKVMQAVKILFESSDEIEIFNKKAIYLYLREITGLNTKQVVNNLQKLRSKYKDFKIKWDNGEQN
jgi:hypothetical protein